MVRSGILSSKQPRHRSKVDNSGSLELSDLTIHGAYFEPIVGIITNSWDPYQPNQGLKFFPWKDKITLFHPYK
jgi:hypothetical protein